jgi:hypothetical protein
MNQDREPPEWRRLESVGNHETREMAREKAVRTAQAVLDGGTGIIEAARKLCWVRTDIRANDDPDFAFFQAVDAETVHLPAGDDARGWDRYRLLSKLEEAQKYESEVRERAFQACRNLIEKFREQPQNPS